MCQAPALQDGYVIAEHLNVRKDVRTHEHGLALRAQGSDEVADFATPDGIQSAHRLVQKNNLPIVDQRLCQTDALQHALLKLAQLAVPSPCLQIYPGQEVFRAAVP